MRYKKYLICYDITETTVRNKVHSLLSAVGQRVNYSVFECELSKRKLNSLRDEIKALINNRQDSVIYYPLCLNCLCGVVSDGLKISRIFDKNIFYI